MTEIASRSSTAVLPVVLAAIFVLPLAVSGTAIALPRISIELGTSPFLLQTVVNGFNAAFALFTLVWGAASDRIGYRRSFRIGIVLVLFASLESAAANGLVLLDLSRIIAGIGSAAVLTGASSILSNAYAGPARGRAFAAFGTVIGLGLALGPTISGILIGWLGWREIFLAHSLVLAFALLGTALLPHIQPVRQKQKLLDLSLLANPHFLALCLVPVAGSLGFVTLLTYLPNALSGIASLSASAAGLFMLPMTLPVLIGPILAARLIHGTGWITPMTIIYFSLAGLIVGDLGMLLLAPGASVWLLVVPMVLVGFGFGLPIGLVDGEALGAVPANRSGTAAGLLNLIRVGSEAISVAAYAAVLAYLISHGLGGSQLAEATAAGQPGQAAVYAGAFHWVIAALTALVAVAAVAVVMLHRAQLRAAAAPTR